MSGQRTHNWTGALTGREMRAECRRKGLCPSCYGARPAAPGKSTCETCLERSRAWKKTRRKPRVKKGYPKHRQCGICGVLGHNARSCSNLPAGERPTLVCTRCTAPSVRGERVCAVHLKTLAELDAEGWVDPPDDEEPT